MLRTGETIIVRMGKKNETSRPVTAKAEAPAPKVKTTEPTAVVAAPVAATTPVANGSAGNGTAGSGTAGAAKKSVAKKKPASAANPAKAAAKKAPAAKLVVFSTEDIALKAYFIHEHRTRLGLPGDEHSDWVEAERQLQAEHKKKTAAKKKPVTAKKRV